MSARTGLSEYTLGLAATALSVGYGALACWLRSRLRLGLFIDPATARLVLAGAAALVVALYRVLYLRDFSIRPLPRGGPSFRCAPPAALADLCQRRRGASHGGGACLPALHLALFAGIGNAPIVFFAEYVLTHSERLTSAFTPGAAPARVSVLRPQPLGLLAVLLAIAVWLPSVSPMLAFGAIAVLCIVTFRRTPLGAEPTRLSETSWPPISPMGPMTFRCAWGLGARPTGLRAWPAWARALQRALSHARHHPHAYSFHGMCFSRCDPRPLRFAPRS